jgi:hypothetical protein
VAVLAVVLGALLGLVVLALAVPVGLEFRVEGAAPFRAEVTIHWLGGLLRFRVPVRGAGAGRAEGRPDRKAGAGGERPGSRGRGRRALSLIREGAFRERLARLARDLLRAIHLRDLRLRARIGLGDPAETGRLWALVGPVAAVAAAMRRADVEIQPEFLDPVLEFQASGRVVVVPLRVLSLAIAFLLSPPSLRAWRTLAASDA